MRCQDLDRHAAFEFAIVTFKHDPHAAPPDLADHRIRPHAGAVGEPIVTAQKLGLTAPLTRRTADLIHDIAVGIAATLMLPLLWMAWLVVAGSFARRRQGTFDLIEVALMPSEEPPTGVGEPGTPPIMPAVANALRRLTGKAARRLPIVRRA